MKRGRQTLRPVTEKSFFLFLKLYVFGFGSDVSQDMEGEKIENRPTHPGVLVWSGLEKYWSAKNEETHNSSPSLIGTPLSSPRQ